MEAVINTVVWAALINGLLLGILYVFSKKHNSLANRILGFFLFSIELEALTIFLPFESIGGYSIYYYFTLPEVKLFFPLLFMHFVLEKVGKTSKYRRLLRIHYIFAFIILAIPLINFLLFLLTGFPILHYVSAQTIEWVYMTQQYYAFLLTVGAFVIVIHETIQYRNLAKNAYSDATMLEINWLWQFISSMFLISLLWGAELARILISGNSSPDIVLATWGLLVLFIYFVSYKAFRHPNLFEGVPEKLEGINYQPQSLDDSKTHDPAVCEKIRSEMVAEKYYLNQDLTISELASKMVISARLISSCINQSFGFNFSEWVNNYRVDEAMAMLESDKHKHLTIEGIGLDAGFKSRSAMYSAFKKKTGQSPGFFRQKVNV